MTITIQHGKEIAVDVGNHRRSLEGFLRKAEPAHADEKSGDVRGGGRFRRHQR